MYEILRIPAFEDNYLFLILDSLEKSACAIDPGDALPILNQLKKIDYKLSKILVTHHHADHVGGIKLLLECFPECEVFASEYDFARQRIPLHPDTLTQSVNADSLIQFAGLSATVWNLSGHTLGHLGYLFEDTQRGVREAFVGDTLFGGGSGGIFEGTHAGMLESLKIIRNWPDDTRIWCAHEYTEKNLWVASLLFPDMPVFKSRLTSVVESRASGQATVPLMLGEEKASNPFLMWDVKEICNALNTEPGLQTFSKIRTFRDKF